MAAYKQRWRRFRKEVDDMAKSSDDEEQQNLNITDEEGSNEDTQNSDHLHIDQRSSTADNRVSDSDHNAGVDGDDINSSEEERLLFSSDDETFTTDDETTSDDNVDEEPVADLAQGLAGWATKHKCTRSSLTELLEILRQQGHRLPKDARTLLKTPRFVDTIHKCGGDYLYLGLESGLLKVIAEHQDYFSRLDTLELSFNIDGVPLFKSSSVQLWPILCSIKCFEPFVVAVFCSDKKPNSVEEYLSDFLQELAELQANGISFGEDQHTLRVSVSAFICDAPARSFIKCIKGHNAYYSCERCVIRGKWSNGRVVYISDDVPAPRLEQRFNNLEYNDHQIKKSPLIDAGLSCIKSFPLDYMHLVCLGIVKRILLFLKQGPRDCRLSHQQLQILSDKLSNLNGKMPREFARQPRSVFHVDKWKATEFRQFLLYTGPLVLRSVVPDRLYKHFLTLTLAMSILLESDDDFRNSRLEYARELLVYFVQNAKLVYGEIFISYNVHALVHLADDVENHATSLNEINAFQFENHLHKLKKKVRNAQNPISQIVKRITEIEKSKCRYRPTCKTMLMYISKKRKDGCFLLKNNKFAFVKEKRENKTYLCDIISKQNLEDFFENPCPSKQLNIAVLNNARRHFVRTLIEHDDILKKVVCLPYERKYVLLPMLHGMERH